MATKNLHFYHFHPNSITKMPSGSLLPPSLRSGSNFDQFSIHFSCDLYLCKSSIYVFFKVFFDLSKGPIRLHFSTQTTTLKHAVNLSKQFSFLKVYGTRLLETTKQATTQRTKARFCRNGFFFFQSGRGPATLYVERTRRALFCTVESFQKRSIKGAKGDLHNES